MTFDAHKDRTALRLRLYENGYTTKLLTPKFIP